MKLQKVKEIAIIAITSSVLTAIIGYGLVTAYIIIPFRAEAFSRGFANWEVKDGGTGGTTFKWEDALTFHARMQQDIAKGLKSGHPDIYDDLANELGNQNSPNEG